MTRDLPTRYSMRDTGEALVHVKKLSRTEDVFGLIQQLRSDVTDGTVTVRGAAARKLGELKAREAVEPLARLLADEDEDVRLTAVDALGSIGSEKARQILRALLQHESASLRRNAVVQLGRLRDEPARSSLMALLASPQPDMRRSAAVALAHFGDPAVQPAIEEAIREEALFTRHWILRFARKNLR